MDDTSKEKNLDTINPTFAGGMWNGVLSMFGAGELYDVAGELRTESSNAQGAIQNAMTNLTMKTFYSMQKGAEVDESIVKLLTNQKAEVDQTMEYYSLMSKYSLYENNVFLKFVYILVFIIIFFMLIR